MDRRLFVKEEELSLAQIYLNSIADERKLKLYWTENLEKKGFNFFYLYNVMVGKVPPSIEFIWVNRNTINPVNWFYTAQDKKPMPVPLTDAPKNYAYYKSKNYNYIKNLKNLCTWCKKHDLSYNTMWYMKEKKRKITFQKMKKLRNILPVRNWFIFC